MAALEREDYVAGAREGTSGGVLTVAFIGCGNISKYHIAALPFDRCVVTVVVDPNRGNADAAADALEARQGRRPRVYAALAEALEASGEFKFDACLVLVPSWATAEGDLHETVATAVLASGRHCLLEKPIAASVAAARRIIQCHAASCPGKTFAVAENAALWPEVRAASDAIAAGKIGRVLTARAKFYESAHGEWAGDYAAGSWRCDASKLPAASFTFDGATHWIRPLRLWLGEVASVAGTGGRTLDHMPGTSMSQHILKFDNGRAAIFESLLAPGAISDQPFFTIQGTEGELVLDGFAGGATLHTTGGGAEVLCREGWDASYRGELGAFVDAALGRRDLGAWTPESALRDLAVVEAMARATETGAWAKPDYAGT